MNTHDQPPAFETSGPSFDEFQLECSSPGDWSDAIPDIDPETKALYESWDEIFDGENEVPIDGLFEGEYSLPGLDSIDTDEQADPILMTIVTRLAMFHVAIDLCEHMTPLASLRMIVKQILPTIRVHPNLAATDIVEHYGTHDFCKQCEAEFAGDGGMWNLDNEPGEKDDQKMRMTARINVDWLT